MSKNSKKLIIKNRILKLFIISIGKILKVDIYRKLYVKKIKGFTISELNQYADDYYNDILKNNEINAVFDLLTKNREDYYYVLCSASLDVIISAIIRKNELFQHNFYSSQLRFEDGVCTGEIINDLLGKKHVFIKRADWVITDNKSDLKLAQAAERKTIVAYKKDLQFWQRNGLNVDIIK